MASKKPLLQATTTVDDQMKRPLRFEKHSLTSIEEEEEEDEDEYEQQTTLVEQQRELEPSNSSDDVDGAKSTSAVVEESTSENCIEHDQVGHSDPVHPRRQLEITSVSKSTFELSKD